ncbi:hypothetical protein D3C79_843690 [compost metagenome]
MQHIPILVLNVYPERLLVNNNIQFSSRQLHSGIRLRIHDRQWIYFDAIRYNRIHLILPGRHCEGIGSLFPKLLIEGAANANDFVIHQYKAIQSCVGGKLQIARPFLYIQ